MPVPKKQDEFFGDDIGSFEKELESPDKLISDEIVSGAKTKPMPQAKSRAMQQGAPMQKIPAFVSLTKYKELRMALREMKSISADMHRTLESLKQNRDGGTELLDKTVKNLEDMDDNIDKVKGVLRV